MANKIPSDLQWADLVSKIKAKANSADLATVATSGSYNDLSNKPTIGTGTLTLKRNSTTLDTFSANATSNKTITINVPTTAADVNALPDTVKYAASLTASINTTTYVMTLTLKDQDGNTLGTAQTIDLPLESVVVNGSYDSTNKKIILTLQSGATVDIPVGDLVAGLQPEITSTNKLSADLVDDTSTTHKFVTAANKTTWNGKQDKLVAGTNISIAADGKTISATDTTYSDFSGATGSAAGAHGLVPAPAAGDNTKYLAGDGTWKTVSVYQLPIASASTLGGIKVGTNLTINSTTGVLSADAQPAILYSGTGQNTDGAMTQKATTDQLALKANSADLATVATSGSYNDLSNKPTIPTVNNATLTIQKNGTTVKTFTANASSNVTANITVPTKTSDITNDSGYLTSIPIATDSVLGGITVGSGLSVTAAGVLSADAQVTEFTTTEWNNLWA